MNTNLTLHADNLWISPYGFSSFVALMEKNLTFDLAEVSLIDFEHLGDKYRSDSLTARVPTLVIPANDGPLFGNWSLVDSELSFMLHRLILNGDSVPERVLAYAQAQWQRPSAIEFTQHARPASVPEGYWNYAGTAPLLPA